MCQGHEGTGRSWGLVPAVRRTGQTGTLLTEQQKTGRYVVVCPAPVCRASLPVRRSPRRENRHADAPMTLYEGGTRDGGTTGLCRAERRLPAIMHVGGGWGTDLYGR